jgi:hypothetical protein
MVELLSYLFRLDGALTVILLNFGYHKVITWHMVNGKFKIFLGNNTTPTDTIYIHSIHTMVTVSMSLMVVILDSSDGGHIRF